MPNEDTRRRYKRDSRDLSEAKRRSVRLLEAVLARPQLARQVGAAPALYPVLVALSLRDVRVLSQDVLRSALPAVRPHVVSSLQIWFRRIDGLMERLRAGPRLAPGAWDTLDAAWIDLTATVGGGEWMGLSCSQEATSPQSTTSSLLGREDPA